VDSDNQPYIIVDLPTFEHIVSGGNLGEGWYGQLNTSSKAILTSEPKEEEQLRGLSIIAEGSQTPNGGWSWNILLKPGTEEKVLSPSFSNSGIINIQDPASPEKKSPPTPDRLRDKLAYLFSRTSPSDRPHLVMTADVSSTVKGGPPSYNYGKEEFNMLAEFFLPIASAQKVLNHSRAGTLTFGDCFLFALDLGLTFVEARAIYKGAMRLVLGKTLRDAAFKEQLERRLVSQYPNDVVLRNAARKSAIADMVRNPRFYIKKTSVEAADHAVEKGIEATTRTHTVPTLVVEKTRLGKKAVTRMRPTRAHAIRTAVHATMNVGMNVMGTALTGKSLLYAIDLLTSKEIPTWVGTTYPDLVNPTLNPNMDSNQIRQMAFERNKQDLAAFWDVWVGVGGVFKLTEKTLPLFQKALPLFKSFHTRFFQSVAEGGDVTALVEKEAPQLLKAMGETPTQANVQRLSQTYRALTSRIRPIVDATGHQAVLVGRTMATLLQEVAPVLIFKATSQAVDIFQEKALTEQQGAAIENDMYLSSYNKVVALGPHARPIASSEQDQARRSNYDAILCDVDANGGAFLDRLVRQTLYLDVDDLAVQSSLSRPGMTMERINRFLSIAQDLGTFPGEDYSTLTSLLVQNYDASALHSLAESPSFEGHSVELWLGIESLATKWLGAAGPSGTLATRRPGASGPSGINAANAALRTDLAGETALRSNLAGETALRTDLASNPIFKQFLSDWQTSVLSLTDENERLKAGMEQILKYVLWGYITHESIPKTTSGTGQTVPSP
jgi:hypothetical protein